jgi:hypothetical protein
MDSMSKQALGAFESNVDGEWTCVKTTEIPIHRGSGSIQVFRGARFRSRAAFAGHNDFPAYLDRVAHEAPEGASHKTD